MTTLPDSVKQSELLNRLVLNRRTLEPLGRIEVMWMYPPAHRVLGFVCKTGFLGNKKLAFKLSQVVAIGADGLLTHSEPDETDAERVRLLESLIHCEVWSQAGQKLGKIIDCMFNLRSGVITDYLVISDRLSQLTGSIYRLPPSKIISFGRQRVLIAEDAIDKLPAYQEGVRQKLAKVSAALKDDYEDVTLELRSLAKRAQLTTQETTEQLKTLTEQAKERAQQLAEQAKDRARELSEEWIETLQTLDDAAPDSDPASEEFEIDWDDEPMPNAVQPRVIQPPIKSSIRQPVPPSASVSPGQRSSPPDPPVQATPANLAWEEEDVWVIGDDLTLQRPTSIAHSPTPPADQVGDLEDDPWDITEPPASKVTSMPASNVDEQPVTDESAITSGTTSTESKRNNNDQPWI